MTPAMHVRRYHRHMTKLGPLVLLAVLAGCPGDDSISIDALPDALQNAECDFEVRCELVPDQATCAAVLPLDNTNELTTIAEVNNGRINYDGKLAKQCVDTFETLGCNLSAIENAVVDSCSQMFSGTIAVGGACIVSEECVDQGNCEQTDPNCDATTACCVGACVAVQPKTAIGATCAGSTCVEGAYCDIPTGTSSGTCKALVQGEDAACDAFDACAAPRECVIPQTMTAGTCKTLPAEGAQCDTQTFLGCNDLRDYCDKTTALCTHHVGVGDACNGPTGATCVGFAMCDAMTSKCVARPSLGDACDESMGLDCIGDLSCVNLKCVGQPTGMTCAL